jgi:hypothetical protein
MKLARRLKKVAKSAVIEVVRARLDSGYKLDIHFSDGTSRILDFQPFLESSGNPMIRAFLDSKRFADFAIRDGDLMWGDYEMCFPIADLYEGRI